MKATLRLGLALAAAASAGAPPALLGACSSSSGGAVNAVGVPDASLVDAFVAPAPDAGASPTSDAGDGAPETDGPVDSDASAGDGGCPGVDDIPDDLSCTGLYSDWAARTIASDAIAYTPGLVFWSDGAVKSRWIYLPPGSSIDTTDMDNWIFPVGTKIWKTFVLNGATIETRLIWKTSASNWTFLDYRWSADGTSARRLDTGETNVNGTSYEVPSTSVCFQCHGGRADSVLGIDLLGLGVAGAQGVTLASLAAQGRFTQPPPATVAVPEDSTKKAAAALGWLHVNCGSSCHNPGGRATATHLYLKLLASELNPADGGPALVKALEAYTTSVNVESNLMPNGVTYKRIAPGDPAHSLVPLLALSRDDDGGFLSMPPLVSHIPDAVGEAPVSAWISALGDAGP